MTDYALNIRTNHPLAETRSVRLTLIGTALFYIGVMIFLPLVVVFIEALRQGMGAYIDAITEPDAQAAIKLTLLTASIAVPLNLVFGLAASWAIAKHDFRGKHLLITFIDLPFCIPGDFWSYLRAIIRLAGGVGPVAGFPNIQILFAVPGIVIATIFVTFPFVAREMISLMQEQGIEEEEAAILLGATGWQTFWRVTLPNVKWGLLYGVLLCNARAMGEFGAVSVVWATSGALRIPSPCMSKFFIMSIILSRPSQWHRCLPFSRLSHYSLKNGWNRGWRKNNGNTRR